MSEPANKAVFLSYASQDAEAAKRIADALRAAGVEVWFDQSELVGGDAWDAKIRGQISSCGLFVPVISANTQARLEGYFRLEWKLAAQRTHTMADEKAFLLPIVIDATRDAEAKVPGEFKTVQWTKLPGGDTPPAFATRVQKLLSGEMEAGRPRSAERGEGVASPIKRGPSKWWWALPIFGVTMALLLVMKEGRKDPAPVPGPEPAPETMASEISRVRASLRPDEWTRADFDALVPTVDRMIQAHPENGDAWALRGVANSLLVIRNLDSGTKPLEVGKEAADRALRLAPKSPLAELALGLHLTAMISRGSDVHAPRLHIERGLAGLPATEALSRYADLTSYWLGYQLDGADKSARAWLAAEPGASFPAWILAQSAVASRRAGEAVKWAEQAAADPDITGIRSFVTLFEARYYLQADLAAARAALDRVPGGQRGVHRVVATRFLVAMAEKHFDRALQELAQTPEAMLRDRVFHGPKALLAGFAHQAAGRTEVAQGFFRDSEKLLREELARDQDNFELRAVLALNLACLGRADEARRELSAVEPLLAGREPSVYTRQPVALIAQAHGVMGEIDQMIPWLRRLITEPSGMPFTPASLRLDSRFGPYMADPRLQGFLTEFVGLDQPGTTLAKADEKSVAVLAFANLSDDKANEYFSDGISEELLNVLAKIPNLKVAARTSAFYFKGKEVPIPEIAKQLGVAYVVEGSVRRQGDKVRITAQLIKAADGFHVWSDTFTRDLKDIFAVQDEIAGLIATNLELKMGMTPAARRTIDPAAYQEYLAGRAMVEAGTTAGIRAGLVHFERVLALEPSFTAAWVQLARTYVHLARWGGLPEGSNGSEATRAIERAVRLEPNSPDVWLALGWVRRTLEWNWRGAEEAFRQALKLRPNHAETIAATAVLLANLGREQESIALAQRAAQLDPLNAATQLDLVIIFYSYGHFAEATQAGRRALQLAPEGQHYHGWLAMSLAEQRKFSEAVTEAGLETDEVTRLTAQAMTAAKQGRVAEAWERMRALEAKATAMQGKGNIHAYVAHVYGHLGETTKGIDHLEKARDARDPSIAWARTSLFAGLHADPRWPGFLRTLGLADDQLK